MEKFHPYDMLWLLNRIQYCVDETKRNKKGWGSSKKYIFQGSYDVWETADDGPKYNKLMDDRLLEAKTLGFIMNDSGKGEVNWKENWHLTEKGLEYLNESKTVS